MFFFRRHRSSLLAIGLLGLLTFVTLDNLILHRLLELDEKRAEAGDADDQVPVLLRMGLRVAQHAAVHYVELDLKRGLRLKQRLDQLDEVPRARLAAQN